MNHAQARAPLQNVTAMQSVYQYLLAQGLDDSVRMIEEESGIPLDEDALANSPGHLLTALSAYEDQRQMAFRIRQPDPEFQAITQWIGTLRDNPEPYGSYEWRKLETHFGANVICVKWQPKEGSQLYAAGSANKNIAICHAEQNASVPNYNSVHASGPVLCLHFNPARPELLLATCMNGGHSIVNVEADEADAVVHTIVAHKKFVVTGKWSPDGLHYITGSHDGFVHVYRAQDGNLSANAWPQVGVVELGNNVEALEWVDATSFYVSVREDNYLHHVSVADGSVREVGKINVNESGDDHVSFNVLDMALAPGGQSIMLATDRHRCILMQKGCSHQIRNFYNIVNDGYSTPRLAWSPSGKHAYVTSQDKCVAVLEIASGRTVHKITGHNINVRDAAMHPFENKLLTGSYDQTCRVWTPAVE